jgi:hypothetical protein
VGSQDISPGNDYARLRNLFFSVLAAGLVLLMAKFVISKNLKGITPKSAVVGLSAPAPPAKKFRPGVEPTGSFTPSLTRSQYNSWPLLDMNDRGDYLFLASPTSADYREILHIYDGKSVLSERLPVGARWGLTPNGNIIKRIDPIFSFQGGRLNGGLVSWAYNDIRFYRRFTDDGSAISIISSQTKKKLTAKLVKDKTGSPLKVFYESHFPLNVLEIENSETIWIEESMNPKGAGNDRLLKFSGGKKEVIALPNGYNSVERIAATGSIVAGTFSNAKEGQPTRSYVKTSADWKELPLPSGAVFSFVQKVFNNGAILGFVTDADRDKMRQVVWQGDSMAVLNDMPAWPKLGLFAIVTRATRRGDIYVRSVLNTETGTSENYLLNLGQ